MTICSRFLKHAALSAACLSLSVAVPAVQAQSGTAVPITAWLVLGPLVARNAAFAAANDSAMLASSRFSVENGWPYAGGAVSWLENSPVVWIIREAPSGSLSFGAPAASSVVYAVTYIDVDRFTTGRLSVGGMAPSQRIVTLDGVRVASDSVTLRRGKHIVLVELLQPAGTALSLMAHFEPAVRAARVSVTTDPRHAVTVEELMKTAEVNDIAVDPKGQRVAWVVRRADEANDRFTTLVEVHDLATGRLISQLGGTDASSPRWSRDGTRLAFLTATDRKGSTSVGRDLWIWDAERGQSERVLRGERGLGGVEWSPKDDWLYYTSTTQLGGPDSFKAGDAQRLTEVWERWNTWSDKAQLNALNLKAGTRLKLVGDTLYSIEGARLSPDGRQIVFARSVRTTSERPWLRAEVWLLDLSDLNAHKLLDLPREAFGAPSHFAWSPDGNAVAFCASAAELLTQRDSTFSVYETELYATNVQHPSLVRLSTGFVPAVSCSQEISWSARDQRIYVTADAGARTIPARTSGPVPSSLDRLPPLESLAFPGETITSSGFGPAVMVAAIQTPTTPSTIYRIPLGGGGAVILDQPSATLMAGPLSVPAWKSWEFTNRRAVDRRPSSLATCRRSSAPPSDMSSWSRTPAAASTRLRSSRLGCS